MTGTERIPGLQTLVQKISDSIEVFVFTTLEPFLKPLMKTATTGLGAASAEVVNNASQYEVFDDPNAVCISFCIVRLLANWLM